MNKKFLRFLALGLLVSSSFCAESDELVAEQAAASNSTPGISPALATLLAAKEVDWSDVLPQVGLSRKGQDAPTIASSVQGGKKKKKGQKTPIVSFEEFYAPLEGDIREAEKSESPKEKLEALSKDYQNVVNTLNKIKKTKAVNKFPVEDGNKLKAYEKAVKIIREKLKNLNKLSGDARATEKEAEGRELAKIEADRAEAARKIQETEAAERKSKAEELKHTFEKTVAASLKIIKRNLKPDHRIRQLIIVIDTAESLSTRIKDLNELEKEITQYLNTNQEIEPTLHNSLNIFHNYVLEKSAFYKAYLRAKETEKK